MSQALAKRLKADLTEKSEPVGPTQVLKTMSLDEQLAQVEELRRKNQQKESEMFNKMKEVMEARADNVSVSHFASLPSTSLFLFNI